MNFLSNLTTKQVHQKTFIVRVDANVPIHEGKILDNSRIVKIIPTLKFLLENQAKVILISHLGRPKGKIVPEMSLWHILPEFKKEFGGLHFIQDIDADELQSKISAIDFGNLIIFENIRFYPQETANDTIFAKKIAKFGDVYVNEAFSCSHRAHASIIGIAKHLPSYGGLLLENELQNLEGIFSNRPKEDIMAIVGGSKVSSKIDLLNSLIRKTNSILIAGGMANTFLFAMGKNVGKSLCEKDLASKALEIMALAKSKNCQIILPSDVVVCNKIEENSSNSQKPVSQVGYGDIIVDLGKNTVSEVFTVLKNHKTIVWNGPLGVCEVSP
ncbi:phosphoglycerate kinase, partial [Flavobacteriaceae bacterium]|nr:phosphoglycerate kinase [Flavobacteriaceae bacterium]